MIGYSSFARIDAHQHFWCYRPEDYPWITAEMRVLQRDYLPRHLCPHLHASGIDASVVVQARPSEAETDFLLNLAAANEWIVGVVGWVDLRAQDLVQRLERWQQCSKLCGFRHQLQDESDVVAFIRDPCVQHGLRQVQEAGKVYEVLVFSHQLKEAIELCARHDRHFLVLDHLGKPTIRTDDFRTWRRELQFLGKMPHVMCKVSGLVAEATDSRGCYDVNQIRPYLETAAEIFGAQRLMFGSDWPVCLLADSYAAVFELISDWTGALSEFERQNILGASAQRCYGLSHAL